MKILLIDNGSSFIGGLQKLLQGRNFFTKTFDEVTYEDVSKSDLIILSGTSRFDLVQYYEMFQKLLDWIFNINVAVIGICFGFELIARYFGCKVELLPAKLKGQIKIDLRPEMMEIYNAISIYVHEAHRYQITKASENISVLAESQFGIEAIKVIDRNIYGFQFHPEAHVDINEGDELFGNLLKYLESSINNI